MAKTADMYFRVDPWKVIEDGFDPKYSRVSESVFSLANESQGVRGCFDEGGTVDSLRGAYVNGVYDLEPIGKSYRGIIDHTHYMIPAAEWLRVRIEADGEVLDLGRSAFRDFTRELDMRSGTLTRRFIWRTASGKEIKLIFLRFLSMTDRERAFQRVTVESLDFEGVVRVEMSLDFASVHEGRGKCFWRDVRAEASHGRVALRARTTASGQEVFAGAVVDMPVPAETGTRGAGAYVRADIPLKKGAAAVITKRAVILFTGSTGDELWREGLTALESAGEKSFEEALEEQKAFWEARWRTSDIVIEPDGRDNADAVAAEQQGVRFCVFQMIQTYNGGSARHNIGAKGLTGEAYNGHAFWDTESCCLPFYLFSDPAAARDLLLFRYNTLPRAMERARALDCGGACYPIATLNGEEACPLWQHASLQMQPSTAVAYGIWHYVRVTGDRDFLWEHGAAMLLEIARYLRSRAARSERTGRYGYFGVMGPDEFHMMVNNNAYTNYMGMRTLLYAADTLEEMAAEKPEEYRALVKEADLTEGETAAWRRIAADMYIPRDDTGLIEQHDGYFDLPHTDIDAIPVTEFPLYEHWSYDRIYRTDMIKQPDVLMMLYLYNSSFTGEEKRVNYEFYQPRTIHESSLSPAIHSILASELKKPEEALNFFGYATRLDLDNYNRNTREGLHITSIAMAWANIVYGFAGLRSDGEELSFAPRMPDRWGRLTFPVRYRGRLIRVRMDREGTAFSLGEGAPITLRIYDLDYTVGAGDTYVPRAGA